jgi:type IV secretory pathway VirB2 component (pilin)
MKKLFITLAICSIFFSFGGVARAVPLETQQDGSANPTIYKLLAPIGSLVCIDTNPDPTKIDKDCASGGIGGYFNTFFQVVIGLAAVLAVVMIIIEGIKYMGSDSVFAKSEGKSGLVSALLGLVIALGAYALLNTISPRLVNSSLTVDPATIILDEEPILSDPVNIPRGVPVAQCSEGIVEYKGFNVCNSIKSNLAAMLTAAEADQVKITGAGFRTREQQQKLYDQNCKNNVCKPITAKPGESMHESGKAFDLKCDGSLINFSPLPAKNGFTQNANTKKCFDWLSKNANRWGFYNLPAEQWHWSVNGK